LDGERLVEVGQTFNYTYISIPLVVEFKHNSSFERPYYRINKLKSQEIFSESPVKAL
jgi:hypothetical protein